MSGEVEIAYIVNTNFKRLSISDKHIAQARNLISLQTLCSQNTSDVAMNIQ